MKVLYKILGLCLCLIPLQLGFAQVKVVDINCTGNFTTIQAAIDNAVNGDTVLVLPGTYFENINFKGKAITVASQYWADGDTNLIINTIINGSRPSHPDSGSVVYFISGEDTNSVLTGFTITGGTGTTVNASPDVYREGGGIFVRYSGANIFKNKIINNHVTAAADTFVGNCAISAFCDMNNFVLRENEISNNSGTNMDGGMAFYTVGLNNKSTCIVENNHIYDNVLNSPNSFAFGGGLGIENFDDKLGNYIIRNNIIINNKMTDNSAGGGVTIQMLFLRLFKQNLGSFSQFI